MAADVELDAPSITEDFVAFCDHYRRPLFDWQREQATLAFSREHGRFKYRLVGLCVSRGNGKSWIGAEFGRWMVVRRPRTHVLSAALTVDGSRVVFGYGRQGFRGAGQSVKVLRDTIEIPSTGSRWTITSREHTSSRGLHPDCVIYDEVGWANDDELFSSLLASQASVADPIMVVISTVGRRRSGPLWRIKELAEAGDPSVYWFHSHETLSPLVTAEFLERQKRILLPAQYAREHQNQWVDAADAITTAADVSWAQSQGWIETPAGEGEYVYELFVDLGLVHDPTVIAVGHREDGWICIDRISTFQGSREAPVQIADVEAMLLELCRTFDVRRIRVESWQGAASVQRLQELGLPVEIQTPTAKTNSEEWPALIQALASHRLILPPHEKLREELLNLTYEVGPSGIRVIDKGSVHQDHAVAVRGVVAGLMRPAPEPIRLWGGPGL